MIKMLRFKTKYLIKERIKFAFSILSDPNRTIITQSTRKFIRRKEISLADYIKFQFTLTKKNKQ